MNVYWSIYNKHIPFLLYEEPESLFNEILKTKDSYKFCPAIKNFCKKTFVLKFPIDYDFIYDENSNRICTSFHDQNFFDQCVYIRSFEEKLITFQSQFLFITEESLQFEITGAYYTDNSFTKNTLFIPGEYDIGNWCRPVDCTFHIRKGTDRVIINSGDAFAYVRFHTNENIKLIKFEMTDGLRSKIDENIGLTKKFNPKQLSLTRWYGMYQHSKSKESILKEVKQNIL